MEKSSQSRKIRKADILQDKARDMEGEEEDYVVGKRSQPSLR